MSSSNRRGALGRIAAAGLLAGSPALRAAGSQAALAATGTATTGLPAAAAAPSVTAATGVAAAASERARTQSWALNTARPTGIHDVAPAPDGGVWFTAQRSGHLGWFDPGTARVELLELGKGSAPHGVIQGPDDAAWITDSGLNAVVRVGWPDRSLRVFPMPEGTPNVNLNTCAFDGDGVLWFTGQNGFIGRVLPTSGKVSVSEAPRGRGPYGICATPSGDIWWCSLAGSYIARIDRRSGATVVVEPPTPNQGARRVWSDSAGRIWVAEWMSGNLSMHDPSAGTWKSWRPPGEAPRVYAVWVDVRDDVWLSDWGANAVLRFDPKTERFESFRFPRASVDIRQILGRPGEVWLPESGTEHISVIRTAG